MKTLALLVLPFLALTSVHAKKAVGRFEKHECKLRIQDLANGRAEFKTLSLRSDSKARWYRLNSYKVSAKLDLHEESESEHLNAYWANRRAITLTILDSKDVLQAQFNNRVEPRLGPFEYQTRTTTLAIDLKCL